jgi:hypothetical protein
MTEQKKNTFSKMFSLVFLSITAITSAMYLPPLTNDHTRYDTYPHHTPLAPLPLGALQIPSRLGQRRCYSEPCLTRSCAEMLTSAGITRIDEKWTMCDRQIELTKDQESGVQAEQEKQEQEEEEEEEMWEFDNDDDMPQSSPLDDSDLDESGDDDGEDEDVELEMARMMLRARVEAGSSPLLKSSLSSKSLSPNTLARPGKRVQFAKNVIVHHYNDEQE